jgi:hypothetical protein
MATRDTQILPYDFFMNMTRDIHHYRPEQYVRFLNELFGSGSSPMFFMNHRENELLTALSENIEHMETERKMMMSFLSDLVRDTPPRFIEMLQWDALYTINAQIHDAHDVRTFTGETELTTRATSFERMLITSTPPSTFECFILVLETYQENDETRRRFVMKYN